MTAILKPIAILGAGAWGTALAIHVAQTGRPVRIWSMEPSEISLINEARSNTRYLPGFSLPDNIQAIANLTDALENVQDVMIAMPSVAFHKTLLALRERDVPNVRVISATKGLEATTGCLLHEIVRQVLGADVPLAVLSGPSFAKEVAAQRPTSLMLASRHHTFAHEIQQALATDMFRVFLTDDVIGVEVGAIIKNIVAIAVGIVDGLQFGANARSAVITQGLQDMIRLGETLGARTETLVGLSGAGDLILTCTDDQSRNRRFGLALGSGKTIAAAEHEIGHVVEGKANLSLALKLAKKQGITLITAKALAHLLAGECDAATALKFILDGESSANLR